MGHWYKEDGKPMYTIIGANGKERGTNLRDARKLNLSPSVTTVLQILDKPGLNNWKEDRILESALTLPRFDKETDKEYFRRIKQDSRELSKLAMSKGTDIHNALESHYKGRVVDRQYIDLCKMVETAVSEYFGVSDGWIAEQSFSHDGYGGKADLIHPLFNIVIDFKTKEKFPLTPKGEVKNMGYDEHIMQLTAYGNGLFDTPSRLANVFVSYDGDIKIHEWTPPQRARGWELFKTTLALWQIQKNFYLEAA